MHFQVLKQDVLKRVSIAPGMSWTFQVEFDPHTATEAHTDNIGVILENGTMMDIELSANPAAVDVDLPKRIDFGTLFRELQENWENSVSKTIEIRNNGKKRTTFNLFHDITLPFTVNPSVVTLGPRGSLDAAGVPNDVATIKVNVIPSHKGPFEYPVKFNVTEGEKITVFIYPTSNTIETLPQTACHASHRRRYIP
jgi:hypothetical protein